MRRSAAKAYVFSREEVKSHDDGGEDFFGSM